MSEEKKDEVRPEMSDPTWTDWVLNQLEDDELEDGNPKVMGLYRVAIKILGRFGVSPLVLQFPTPDNLNRATATVTIAFPDGMQYGGSADVCSRNCDAPFNQHPVAVAETRALGRALKLALAVKKVTAEELSDNADAAAEDDETPITHNQEKVIETMCKRNKINLVAFVNSRTRKYKSIKEVSLNSAQTMITELNKYQQSKKEVPEELKGYDASWQESFGG